jgi:CBS domain-containing protein
MKTRHTFGLGSLAVSEAMHAGVVSCPPETPLHDVAQMMARYSIHAVVVYTENAEADGAVGLWGVVADTDLIGAAAKEDFAGRTAGETAQTPVVMIYPHESLKRAAELMDEQCVTHLLVVSASSERPLGVLSTLDLARAIAAEPSGPA